MKHHRFKPRKVNAMSINTISIIITRQFLSYSDTREQAWQIGSKRVNIMRLARPTLQKHKRHYYILRQLISKQAAKTMVFSLTLLLETITIKANFGWKSHHFWYALISFLCLLLTLRSYLFVRYRYVKPKEDSLL